MAGQVVKLDAVEVHQGEAAYAGFGQLDGYLRPEAAEAYYHHALVLQNAQLQYTVVARVEVLLRGDGPGLIGSPVRPHGATTVLGHTHRVVCVCIGCRMCFPGEEHRPTQAVGVFQRLEVQVHYALAFPFVSHSRGSNNIP